MRAIIPAIVAMLSSWSASAWAAPTYFLVAEITPFHHDSYILPLENPQDIAHARDLIARGPDLAGQPIIIADFVRQADGINGDYLEPGIRPWSWHVTEFKGFADFTIEILDGNPTQVEDGTFPGPTMGFWSYTVKAELGPTVPEPAGVLAVTTLLLALAMRRPRRIQLMMWRPQQWRESCGSWPGRSRLACSA
jgi:hypothetical protein